MANALLKDFRTQLRTKFAEDRESMSYSEWISKNTKHRKKPYSYEGFEFQKQIVDDMSRNLSVIKCSQIGLTEIQLRKFAAFLTRNTAVNAIFTLPNDDMYRRISTTRFAPIIASEPVFNLHGGEKVIRRMDLYQINQSFGYFTGNKEGDATSINADALFHDEVDLSDQEMLALFQSRLQGSDYRITQGFSTPTFEGFGIDATFRASDQHEYLIRCTHCNHHNIVEFTPDFVHIPGLSSDINDLTEIDPDMAAKLDLDNSYLMCESCHEPLQIHDPSLRQWVPRHPGRRSRGYRVSPFCRPSLGIDYIVDQLLLYKSKDAMRRFYNTVLGKSYNDSNARLSELDIRAVMGEARKTDHKGSPVVLGIDVGITCHLTMMRLDQRNVFEWRHVLADNLVNEVERIMQEYNVVAGCMDRDPYTPLANEIRELTHGIIMPVEYAKQPNAQAMVFVKDELNNITHIRVNRTVMIDAAATAVRKRRVSFTGYGHHESMIIEHLRDMVRIEKEDEVAVWQKLNGNDHYFHSLGYCLFADRANTGLLFRSDADIRSMSSQFTVTTQTLPEINMKNRRKQPTLLGSI